MIWTTLALRAGAVPTCRGVWHAVFP